MMTDFSDLKVREEIQRVLTKNGPLSFGQIKHKSSYLKDTFHGQPHRELKRILYDMMEKGQLYQCKDRGKPRWSLTNIPRTRNQLQSNHATHQQRSRGDRHRNLSSAVSHGSHPTYLPHFVEEKQEQDFQHDNAPAISHLIAEDFQIDWNKDGEKYTRCCLYSIDVFNEEEENIGDSFGLVLPQPIPDEALHHIRCPVCLSYVHLVDVIFDDVHCDKQLEFQTRSEEKDNSEATQRLIRMTMISAKGHSMEHQLSQNEIMLIEKYNEILCDKLPLDHIKSTMKFHHLVPLKKQHYDAVEMDIDFERLSLICNGIEMKVCCQIDYANFIFTFHFIRFVDIKSDIAHSGECCLNLGDDRELVENHHSETEITER